MEIEEFYLDSVPSWIAEPFSWVGHIPFAMWLIKKQKPNLFVELGTHTGNSYFAFCQSILESRLDTKSFAVDTWSGDAHSGQYEDTVFESVLLNNQIHYSSFSKLMRMTFDEALDSFSDKSIDLLHIDGFHTYEAVSHDFATWLPKVSDDGIILFHDISVKERDFGVYKFWDELKKRYKTFSFDHSNGLGILFLNDNNLIYKALVSTDNNELVREYFSEISSFYCITEGAIEMEPKMELQFFYDVGNGFNEEDSVRDIVDLKGEYVFHTQEISQDIKMLRFDPSHKGGLYFVYDLIVEDDMGSAHSLKNPNQGNFSKSNTNLGMYYFSTDDPHLIFDIPSNTKTVNFKYICVNQTKNFASLLVSEIPKLKQENHKLMTLNQALLDREKNLEDKVEKLEIEKERLQSFIDRIGGIENQLDLIELSVKNNHEYYIAQARDSKIDTQDRIDESFEKIQDSISSYYTAMQDVNSNNTIKLYWVLREENLRRYKLKLPFRLLKRVFQFFLNPIRTMKYFSERRALKNSDLFDPYYYLSQKPELIMSEMNPIRHFLQVGWKIGLNPNKDFNLKTYVEQFPELKEDVNPFVHYVNSGIFENRL